MSRKISNFFSETSKRLFRGFFQSTIYLFWPEAIRCHLHSLIFFRNDISFDCGESHLLSYIPKLETRLTGCVVSSVVRMVRGIEFETKRARKRFQSLTFASLQDAVT
jgi:hypothetical protein